MHKHLWEQKGGIQDVTNGCNIIHSFSTASAVMGHRGAGVSHSCRV